jgi:hypothetical protein
MLAHVSSIGIACTTVIISARITGLGHRSDIMNTLVPEPLYIMCPPAGFASQPAAGADTFGLRPLNAIAATGGGGVPQARIRRILADLVEPLTALHDQGRVHGAISTGTIGLDESGAAHLMVPAIDGGANAEHASRAAGFAAFEQHSDDPGLVCGPWTDIYALRAVACSLITGSPPPDAISRRVRDDYTPLAERLLEGYDAAFLQGVDAGLAMAAARRPKSMQGYGQRLNLPDVAPAAVPAVVEPEVVLVRDGYPDDEDHEPADIGHKRKRHPILWLLPVIVAVLAWFFWMQGQGRQGNRVTRTGSDTQVAQTGTGTPAPGAGQQAPSVTPTPASPSSSSFNSPATSPAPEAAKPPVAGTPAKTAEPPPAGRAMAPAAPNPPAAERASGGGMSVGGRASEVKVAGPEPVLSSTVLGGGSSRSAPAPVGPASGSGAVPTAAAAKPSRTPVVIRIDVRPWGEVLIDGASQGVSPPLKELKLAPGKHHVTVRNTGMPSYSTTIEVKAGVPATISHVFQ